MKERKIVITVETCEVLIISRRGSLSRRWCDGCGKPVAMISLSDDCMSGFSIKAAQRQEMIGRLHLIETAEGLSLICLNSLAQE